MRDDDRPLGDQISLVDVILRALVRDPCGCDRVPAQGFLHERIDVWEVLAVGEGGQTGASDYALEFLVGLVLDLWVEGHCEEECGEDGDGLVDSDQFTLFVRVTWLVPREGWCDEPYQLLQYRVTPQSI